jgi:membrane protein
LAAALAYYGMFSFAPVIYVAFRIAGRFVDQLAVADQLYQKLQNLLGPETAALVKDLVAALAPSNNSSSILISLVSLGAIYFAASGLFFQVQYALNSIWKVSPPKKGSTTTYLRKRLFSFVIVIGVGLLFVGATLINVLLAWFGSLMEALLGLGNVQIVLTWIATLGLITVSFALLYKVLPDVKIPWRDVWLGAFSAAVLAMAAGGLAIFYFSFIKVGSALEAAGAFTVLVMAIFYIAQIFLLGAVITRVHASASGVINLDLEPASQS